MNSVAVARGVGAHRRKPREGAAHVEQACTCLQHRRKPVDARELRLWAVCYTPRLFEQRSTKLFASSRRGMDVAPYGFSQTHRSPVEGARAARSGSRASPSYRKSRSGGFDAYRTAPGLLVWPPLSERRVCAAPGHSKPGSARLGRLR